jgi:hypothetical protein
LANAGAGKDGETVPEACKREKSTYTGCAFRPRLQIDVAGFDEGVHSSWMFEPVSVKCETSLGRLKSEIGKSRLETAGKNPAMSAEFP